MSITQRLGEKTINQRDHLYHNKEENKMAVKKTERVSARVSAPVYETLSQAARLTGATLNQFIVQSALGKAQEVIEHEQVINMTMRDASVFLEAIENPPAPNNKLKDAMKKYRESFSDAENRST